MNWGEFKEQVRVFLHVHNRRQGIQTLIDSLMKAAVLDLQAALPHLRERTQTDMDAASEGYCGVVQVPAGCRILDIAVSDAANPDRWGTPTRLFSTTALRDMRLGLIDGQANAFVFDVPTGRIYITPDPNVAGTTVNVTYSAMTAEFVDTDDVRLGLREAQAVAEYILQRLAETVDNDLQAAQLHAGLFRQHKRQIYSNAAESGLI